MTVPHWRISASRPRTPCDAVVIGAGICGISAALAMERRGLDVRVVERHTLGSGASSRNAGFLMRGCADHYADACKLYGRERAKALWRLTEENLALLRAEGAADLPSYRATPSCLLALDRRQERELMSACQMLQEDGFHAPWLTSGSDSAWAGESGRRLRGGLINPDDASINPVELLRMLAGKLRRPILENQEVFATEVIDGAEIVEVHTADAVLVSPRVLVCTNAFGPLLFPGLAELVTPRRGQMIALRYPQDRRVSLAFSYYFNHGSEYFRQTPDGTIVFGGCRTYHAAREVGYEDRLTPWVQNDIERWATDMLGCGYEVIARWAGTMGFSPDGLPLIGPIPGVVSGAGGAAGLRGARGAGGVAGPGAAGAGRARVWFCGGFTGHGMSMGFKTAQIAVGAMLDGAENPFDLARVM